MTAVIIRSPLPFRADVWSLFVPGCVCKIGALRASHLALFGGVRSREPMSPGSGRGRCLGPSLTIRAARQDQAFQQRLASWVVVMLATPAIGLLVNSWVPVLK